MRSVLSTALLSLGLAGCGGDDTTTGDSASTETDADTDADSDTDTDTDTDTDADSDADTDTDVDADTDTDTDGDGDGDGVSVEDDCDDTDASVYPGASEVWGDGIDQDCDGVADAEGTSCSADLTVAFPDGMSTTLDGCIALTFAATHDYSADAPEVGAFSITLGATAEAIFDCRVEFAQSGVCGEGYYDQRESTMQTTMVLKDCAGVGNDYEGTFSATQGYLRIDTVDAGIGGGDHAGQPLTNSLEGHLHVWTDDGIDLEGDIALTLTQVAGDGEEQTECVVTDGDEDGDGYVTAINFDGDDCDDESATIFMLHMKCADTWQDDGSLTNPDCTLSSRN